MIANLGFSPAIRLVKSISYKSPILFISVWTLQNLVWIFNFRENRPYDIDEAGYISSALTIVWRFNEEGLVGLIKSFYAPSPVAPLVPMVSAVSFLLFGWSSPIYALLTPLFFATLTLIVTYKLACLLSTQSRSLVAVILVAANPIVIYYSRSYQFVTAASFFTTSAMYCLIKIGQQNGNRLTKRYSLLLGLSIGLMLISRTMTLAFLPALLASGLYLLYKKRQSYSLLIPFLFGLVTTAGFWFFASWKEVWTYLSSFGYGSRAQEYGEKTNIWSIEAWKSTLDYVLAFSYFPLVFLGVVFLAYVVYQSKLW
jgi:4-amino-4-deoxy-L-arabinose transferase-like glycosyltransferase